MALDLLDGARLSGLILIWVRHYICRQPRPYLRPHRRLRNPPDPCSRSSPTPNGSTGHSRISAAYSTTHTSESPYDKRPRKTHPLTPTKQAAGSPRSGRVIRYGLRDDRRRGIDATKPQISLAVCTTILNAPGQTFYRPETLRNDSMPCATVLMRRFSDDVGDRFSSEPDEHSSEQTGLAPSHLQRCSDSSRRKQ